MNDIFEPRHEPAKSIYLAFQLEASKRSNRSFDQSTIAERNAVFDECIKQADALNLKKLSIDQVEDAQRYAMGSIDYGATWAYQLVNIMKAS